MRTANAIEFPGEDPVEREPSTPATAVSISSTAASTTVDVLVPATKVRDREAIYQAIRSVNVAGRTALFAGVSKGARELGFARLDRVGAGQGARLRATLYSVPRWQPWGRRARPQAAFAVDREGRVERVDPPPPSG